MSMKTLPIRRIAKRVRKALADRAEPATPAQFRKKMKAIAAGQLIMGQWPLCETFHKGLALFFQFAILRKFGA